MKKCHNGTMIDINEEEIGNEWTRNSRYNIVTYFYADTRANIIRNNNIPLLYK